MNVEVRGGRKSAYIVVCLFRKCYPLVCKRSIFYKQVQNNLQQLQKNDIHRFVVRRISPPEKQHGLHNTL